MNIPEAKLALLRTHLAALKLGDRPNGYLLESGPGIGKSDAVMQMAADLAKTIDEPVGVVVFMLATISSVDVRGFMLPQKTTSGLDTIFSTPPWFPTQANTHVVQPDGTWSRPNSGQLVPRVGVLFLDEFSQAEDDVKKPAAELVYKGVVGTCELPVGWRVIAAGNRMTDRSGVMRELMFIVNRRCRLSVDASAIAWRDYQNALPEGRRAHYLTISFAEKNPDLVFRDAVPAGSDPFCTPRTLCLMDRDLRALRTDAEIERDVLPSDPIAKEVCAGWIGAGEAAQFFTHLKFADELPDIREIMDAPTKAKLPAQRDAQMVCGYMLAHHVSDKTARAIMTYLGRLKTEMQVLAVRAILANPERAGSVVNTREMTDWLLKNQALLAASRS